MTRYLVIVTVVVAAVIGLWHTANSVTASSPDSIPTSEHTTATEQDTNRRLLVRASQARYVQSVQQTREYTGTIKARRASQLSFERAGRVTEILVDEGKQVENGQLLAKLDVELVRAQRSSASASLDQARAVFEELQAGPREQTIAAAKARLESLTTIAARTKNDLERSERLIASGAIPREQLDTNRFKWQSAVSESEAAEKQLDELLAGTRIERLSAQQATVRQLEADLKRLDLDLEDGKIHAPFRGRITERLVDEGTVVSHGTSVLHIIEDAFLEAWIGIPAPSAARMQPGTTYELAVEGRSVDGELASLRPQLDPITRTRNAIFQLDPQQVAEAGFVPGQIVRLRLQEDVDCSGIELPSTALIPGPRGLWNVFVIDTTKTPAVIQRRTVELLYTQRDVSIVTGTLSDGEVIVIDGTHRVASGQAVDVQIEGGPAQ